MYNQSFTFLRPSHIWKHLMRVVWTITCMRTKFMCMKSKCSHKNISWEQRVSYENSKFSWEHIASKHMALILAFPKNFLFKCKWASMSQILALTNNSVFRIEFYFNKQLNQTFERIQCINCVLYSYSVHQGFPDRGPRAQIWAPDRLLLGPLGLKYMHWIWAFGP